MFSGLTLALQPGEKRGAITETSIIKFLNDVKAGNEEVRTVLHHK